MSELVRSPARRATMEGAARRKAEEEFDDQEEGRRALGFHRRPSDSPPWRARESRR
jgi:hypothetical protein